MCVTKTELVVRFVGLECNVRQEGHGRSVRRRRRGWTVQSQVAERTRSRVAIGTVEMGPEGIEDLDAESGRSRGPIEDAILVGTLIEHDDFADIEDASRKIADKNR